MIVIVVNIVIVIIVVVDDCDNGDVAFELIKEVCYLALFAVDSFDFAVVVSVIRPSIVSYVAE